jgi:hypothetical protein
MLKFQDLKPLNHLAHEVKQCSTKCKYKQHDKMLKDALLTALDNKRIQTVVDKIIDAYMMTDFDTLAVIVASNEFEVCVADILKVFVEVQRKLASDSGYTNRVECFKQSCQSSAPKINRTLRVFIPFLKLLTKKSIRDELDKLLHQYIENMESFHAEFQAAHSSQNSVKTKKAPMSPKAVKPKKRKTTIR